MNEEDKEYKFSVPLITNIELEQIDKSQDKLINELYKHIYHDKELIILQRIICNQEKTIKEQEKVIDEMALEIRRMTNYTNVLMKCFWKRICNEKSRQNCEEKLCDECIKQYFINKVKEK